MKHSWYTEKVKAVAMMGASTERELELTAMSHIQVPTELLSSHSKPGLSVDPHAIVSKHCENQNLFLYS